MHQRSRMGSIVCAFLGVLGFAGAAGGVTVSMAGENHDIAVADLAVPFSRIMIGDVVTVTVTVANLGDWIEGPFQVTLGRDGENVGAQTVPALDPGREQTLVFAWDTSGQDRGEATIEARAEVVPGESDVGNNGAEITVSLYRGIYLSFDRDGYMDGDPPCYVHNCDVLRRGLDDETQEIIVGGLDNEIYTLDALSVRDDGDILFSMADEGFVWGRDGRAVFLTQDDVGSIDSETGAISSFINGADWGIGSIDALAVPCVRWAVFSPNEDGYVGLGNDRIFLAEEDLGVLDMDSGKIYPYVDGSQFGMWSLDAVEIVSMTKVLFSPGRDQYFTESGLFLSQNDVGMLNLKTGQVSLWLEGGSRDLPSIDALSR